jgi:hypothetical protein
MWTVLTLDFWIKIKEVHHLLRILHCAFGRMLRVSNASLAHDIDPVQAIGASDELPVNKAPCLGEEELRRVRRL